MTPPLRIVIVSPGDVADERDIAERVIGEVNRDTAEPAGATLRTVRWESASRAGLHSGGMQGIIDERLRIPDADLVLGIFWNRFGTPTAGEASGSAHEIKQTLSAWREHGRPDLMLFFSRRPASLETAEDARQSVAVREFKESLPSEVGWWNYADHADFEQQLRRQLNDWLRGQGERAAADEPPAARDDTGLLDAPAYADVVSRDGLSKRLQTAIAAKPLVIVEGLAGTGKSYIASEYLRLTGGAPLWYDVPARVTLDELLTALGSQLRFEGTSPLSRSKEAVHQLGETRRILVLDNLHVDAVDSFRPLLEAAVRANPPARILVLSRTRVELPGSYGDDARIVVGGLSTMEIGRMIARRGLRLASDQLEELRAQTDGLPLGVELFATLVRDGRDPHALLAKRLGRTKQLQRWFGEVCADLTPDARRLLNVLAVSGRSFNRGIVAMAGRVAQIDDVEEAFDDLLQAHLVRTHVRRRWDVHALLANFARETLDEDEFRQIHSAYADEFADWRRADQLDDRVFRTCVIAVRHLHDAGRPRDAAKLIARIVRTGKTHGHYEALIDLCGRQRELEEEPDPWIAYHYAHCCMIIGRLRAARDAILRLDEDTVTQPTVALQLARLHAEVMLNLGDVSAGLDILAPAIERWPRAKRQVRAQAKAAEATLRLAAGDIEAAEALGTELVRTSTEVGDDIGFAVGVTHVAYAWLARGDAEKAIGAFRDGARRFHRYEHRRGESWAMAGAVLAQIASGRADEAQAELEKTLAMRSGLGECSAEYARFLTQANDAFEGPRVLAEELQRVTSTLARERRVGV